jgi:hypothetical protein
MDTLETALQSLPDNTELSVLTFITSKNVKDPTRNNVTSSGSCGSPWRGINKETSKT